MWPDKEHNFPWDENFNTDWKFKQPLLDRNTDFKFYERRNLGVYSTSQAQEGNPILYVYHNDDGDWNFIQATSRILMMQNLFAWKRSRSLIRQSMNYTIYNMVEAHGEKTRMLTGNMKKIWDEQ